MTTFFVSKNAAKSKTSVNNRLDNLTPRGLDVLHLLTKGLSNREIAAELYLTTGTIRIYLSTIYGKLGVSSRMQAAIMAKNYGM